MFSLWVQRIRLLLLDSPFWAELSVPSLQQSWPELLLQPQNHLMSEGGRNSVHLHKSTTEPSLLQLLLLLPEERGKRKYSRPFGGPVLGGVLVNLSWTLLSRVLSCKSSVPYKEVAQKHQSQAVEVITQTFRHLETALHLVPHLSLPPQR